MGVGAPLILMTFCPMVTDLDGCLAGESRGSWEPGARHSRQGACLVPGGPNEGEVFSSRQDLSLGHRHIFLTASYDENWLLAPNRRFDIGVGLGSQRLDLTA